MQENENKYEKVQVMKDFCGAIWSIEYHHDSGRLFIGTSDKEKVIWKYNLEKKEFEKLKNLEDEQSGCKGFCYCPITKILFSGNRSTNNITIWRENEIEDFGVFQVL